MLSNSFFSILDRLLSAGFKFIAILLLGNWLGPSGQGIFSYYLVIWAWAGTLSSLGLGVSNNFYGAKESSPQQKATLVGNTVLYGLVSGLLNTLLFSIIATQTDLFKIFSENHIPILLIGVFIHAFYYPLLGLLVGLGKFQVRATSSVVVFLVFFGLIWVNYQSGQSDSLSVSIMWLWATGIGMLIWFLVCFKSSCFKISFDWTTLKKQVSYGLKSYWFSLLSSALARVDLILISYLLGAEATGIYSIALYFSEVLMYFPSALTTVLLSAVGKGKSIQVDFYRYISTLFLLAIILMGLFIPISVQLLFPLEYSAAIFPSIIMLFGVFWMGIGNIAVFQIFGTKNNWAPIKAVLIAIIVEIGLILILTPHLNLVGVAISSSIAYSVFGIIIMINLASNNYSVSPTVLLLPKNPLPMIRERFCEYNNKHI